MNGSLMLDQAMIGPPGAPSTCLRTTTTEGLAPSNYMSGQTKLGPTKLCLTQSPFKSEEIAEHVHQVGTTGKSYLVRS